MGAEGGLRPTGASRGLVSLENLVEAEEMHYALIGYSEILLLLSNLILNRKIVEENFIQLIQRFLQDNLQSFSCRFIIFLQI